MRNKQEKVVERKRMVAVCIIPPNTENGKSIVAGQNYRFFAHEKITFRVAMADKKKRFEFENTFGNNSRSPKRPKLEVFQRPSTSGTRCESFENVEENDELWGDELENDVMQEVLFLESQVLTQKTPVPKSEPIPSTSFGVFKPKTASAIPKNTPRIVRDSGCGDVLRDSGVSLTVKESRISEHRFISPQSNVPGVIKPLVVAKVKSHSVGKGCNRSNSMPTIRTPGSNTVTSKPWNEIRDLSRKITDDAVGKNSVQKNPTSSIDKSEEIKSLKREIESLRSEAFTKSGEAALLRQKVKDASLDLERERNYRATLLEKTNQKHQQEILSLNRELETAKTQLQFKELDVGKAVEKCKLLEAGNLKVRPMELKLHSTLRPGSTSDFPSRSTFEEFTPKKKANQGDGMKGKKSLQKATEHTSSKRVVSDVGIQTEDKLLAMRKSRPELFSRVSEGDILGRLIVPVWFEMDSGANEEHFENKQEGVSAVTELLKMTTFQGKPIESLIEWCWKCMLSFLSTLQKRSEDDYKFHKIREESRRQYEEWCLDRRIPLPPQKQSVDEGLSEEWLDGFCEDFTKYELQSLLSFRPWCPKDVLPEIRRTLALMTAVIKVSRKVAPIFASHNQRKGDENVSCYTCGNVIEEKLMPEREKTTGGHGGYNSGKDVFEDAQEETGDSHIRPGNEFDAEGMRRKSALPGCSKDLETGGRHACFDSKKPAESDKELELEREPKEILKFDFIHLVQQICRVISGMRKVLPMEGTLAGVLGFLTSINEQLALSERGLILLSAVIKDILFIRPRLQILPFLMRLLTVTGAYPLVPQKLCVNSAWNTAYRDRSNNIWMFSKGVCPLQVLITLLGNVVDESFPEEVSKEVWFKFRVKIGLLFVQWLDAALTQPGHQVNWLCYATSDESENSQRGNDNTGLDNRESVDSAEKVKHSKEEVATKDGCKVKKGNLNLSPGKDHEEDDEKMDLGGDCEDSNGEEYGGEDVPSRTMSKLSISKVNAKESDDEKEEEEEQRKLCCCRRWAINVLVNILYAVLSDLQCIAKPDFELTISEEENKFLLHGVRTTISNKHLEREQSVCLRLGLFVLRALLRRDHPELNTPGGEGFLWNHYTVRGSVLVNGQIVRKDYSHKNAHGGPIGGRYVLLLSTIEKQMKKRILDFCPETEKALQELLEVEHSVQAPSEDDEEGEEDADIWKCMRYIGCSENT